jgi:hypothetical protein
LLRVVGSLADLAPHGVGGGHVDLSATHMASGAPGGRPARDPLPRPTANRKYAKRRMPERISAG